MCVCVKKGKKNENWRKKESLKAHVAHFFGRVNEYFIRHIIIISLDTHGALFNKFDRRI